MNVDCTNFDHFRVTRHPNGSETVLDTRNGHATAMRRTLAEIHKEATDNGASGAGVRVSIVKALEMQLNPY